MHSKRKHKVQDKTFPHKIQLKTTEDFDISDLNLSDMFIQLKRVDFGLFCFVFFFYRIYSRIYKK